MATRIVRSVRGGTPAVVVLERAGVAHTLHTYGHDPASTLGYGLEAAEALGVDPAQVFKTLMVDVDGRLVVGVVPVDKQPADLLRLTAATTAELAR